MPSLRLTLLSLMCALVSASCASTPPVQSVETICPRPPPPPAWTLKPPPDLAQMLNRLISISDAP